MIKKPFLNGLLASAYIFVLALVMNIGEKFAYQPDTFLMPVLFLSLFTLSAAVVGYLFCFESIQLLVVGKKQQAIKYFLQTTGTFAVITVIVLILVFSGFNIG